MPTTLSEVYEDHPIHLQHIVPIDFSSAQTLPDSHAWSQSDGFSSGSSSVFPDTPADDRLFSIPLIDLMNPNASDLICQACESWGAFQLIGHGIPSKLIEEVDSESRRLFALPSEQKLKTLRSPGGAAGYGIARISPFFPKYMWHEGFTILGSSKDHAKELWPHDYERFCETMDEYQKQMKMISHKLIRMMLKHLNISEEEVKWIGSTTESTALQLNSYPACPDPDRAMGLAPHTDTSLMTLVHQSQISGLQIHKEGVGWVRVHPIYGALAINVGDLLHILSNGRFPSAFHRVTVNQTMQRFSVAYFYGPPVDFTVSPLLSKDVSGSGEVEAPLYRSVTVKEYVGMKAKYLEKALSLLKN
ncbi:gibberellin 3-beta-dioxygenase 1 [Ziziphus jujuba]|uniref:Gibberellin 3-beta-dioxygenase 1 n=1 Tax=Ziziphus jujuba TaxID=326968 RepID=A0ABM3INK2_ZIZJJ|nr:gibberellin 3-beta-dioxygenase 1 [Ziziphus jujuba]